MQERKIVATKRLQDEGHWNEASLYREGIRENTTQSRDDLPRARQFEGVTV